ncbi:YtxH domain-containing protein [Paenibacillus sp. HJL G12]|uniref:YtxH domain-containing protein n=1 Tax=Paenibacillus dendrobii TaxID=2691084 RepID=A0A7X3LLB3_9BACL|nr:YtxH domain-containing protein [Paenibacillus dendrobii]MWV47314.1 YtxH domain-containing protein [Paenibacillus dendrobii]
MNKAETEYPVQSSSTFFKGALIGGLIGAAAALLFAPKPGRELRGDLTDKISTMTDKTKEVACVVGEKATDLAKSVSSKTTELAKSVNEGKNSIMESVKQASADVSDDVKDASKDLKDASEDASRDVRKEMNKTSY